MQSCKFCVGDEFVLVKPQCDDDELGNPRTTPAGSIVRIDRVWPDQRACYQISCPATGGWWFFGEEELASQCSIR